MTPKSVESLMVDIEAEDPLDLADLALSEDDARSLMASHFCEIDNQLAERGLDVEARLEIMAAIAAHTMVENLVLHIRRMRAAVQRDDFREWMKRHGMG